MSYQPETFNQMFLKIIKEMWWVFVVTALAAAGLTYLIIKAIPLIAHATKTA